jgi:hypothetical protein
MRMAVSFPAGWWLGPFPASARDDFLALQGFLHKFSAII